MTICLDPSDRTKKNKVWNYCPDGFRPVLLFQESLLQCDASNHDICVACEVCFEGLTYRCGILLIASISICIPIWRTATGRLHLTSMQHNCCARARGEHENSQNNSDQGDIFMREQHGSISSTSVPGMKFLGTLEKPPFQYTLRHYHSQ